MDARTFDWGFQPRAYNFILGVLLPINLLISLCWLAIRQPLCLAHLVVLACSFAIIISSAALAAYCVYPKTGKQSWVRYSVGAGIFFWTPVAFLWCTVTFLLALLASLLMTVTLKLGARAILPLYAKDSRFSLKQVFWLITLCALLLAALSPWLRSIENVVGLLYGIHAFILFATPVLAAIAFSAVNLDIKDL